MKYATVGLLVVMALVSADAGPKKDESFVPHQQRMFDRIQVEGAWKITKGNPKILVGVIDNGFDFFHPDLKGQLLPGMYYPGGYHPQTYVNIAHGTQVASIIVAKDDGAKGMTGLAPECKVVTASQGTLEHVLLKMRAEFFRANPKAILRDFQEELAKNQESLEKFGRSWILYQVEGAAAAIHGLVDRGVKVINISGALKKSLCPAPKSWKKLEEAFSYAAKHNVVIVLAAGNSASRWEDYPGSAKTVLVVGATMLNDTRWEQELDQRGTKIVQGSNFGNRLSLMAPVEDIVVCRPHEDRFYSSQDGPFGKQRIPFKGAFEITPIGATSSAAPIVTSLVALIYSVQSKIDARSVVSIVERGCDDIGEKGYDIRTGHGRVNFAKSLELARKWNQP